MNNQPVAIQTSALALKRYLMLFLLFFAQWLCFAQTAHAQVAYAINRTSTFILNPTSGTLTLPAVTSNYFATLGYESTAMAVSPWNGLLYLIERTTTNTPRFATWNPQTGQSVNLGTAPALTNDMIRATFCPDGRFYVQGQGNAAAASSRIFEINPVSLALIRTITVSNVAANNNGTSGDLTCDNTGNIYIVAQNGTAAGANYSLYRLTGAQITTGGTQAAALIGDMGSTFDTRPPVGVVEVDSGTTGCAAAPNPCLIVTSFTLPTTWSINSTNGAATTLTTANGFATTDLSREFKRDVSITKTTAPTVLQGTTISYTVTVVNPGPAIAQNVSVRDVLANTIFNVPAASWTCAVVQAGTPTALTTACATPSGTGNLSTTVSLSIGSTIRFVITAPVFITATGTVTNTAVANPTGTVFDTTPSNNTVTTVSFIQKAANLSVTKTDGLTTATAGQFLTYTVTFTNSGPGDANGATVTDARTAGLSNCTVLSCVATGTSSCPVTPANILNPGGTTLPSFQPSTSVTFSIRCGVTASGI